MLDRFTANGSPALVVRRPVHVCPSCLGTTRELDIQLCPACDVEVLARVPVTGRVATSEPTRMGRAPAVGI